MAEQGRHLYFIKISKGRGPVKIGRANDPGIRLATLQVASPYRLKLLGVLEGCGAYEGDFHWYLSEHRMLGEWFRWGAKTEEVVKLALSGGDWPALVTVHPIPVIEEDDWRIGSPLYANNPQYQVRT